MLSEAANACVLAAIAATEFVGGGDEKAADQAAVDAMREQLNMLDINGTIVIGEGERDEAYPSITIGHRNTAQQQARQHLICA